MSSILDALRKLEEERSQHQAAHETPLPIEPPTREPAPRRSRARRSRRAQNRNTKLWVAAPVGVFGVGVILAAVAGGFGGGSDDDSTVMANAPAYDASDAGLPAVRDPQIDRIESDLREVAESPIQEVPSTSPDPVLMEPIQSAPESLPDPDPEPEPVAVQAPAPGPDTVSAANVAPIQLDVEPIAPEPDPEPEPMPEEEPPADLPPTPVEREPVEVAQAPEPTFEPEPAPEAVAPPPRTEPSERYERMMEMTDDAFRAPASTEEAPEPAVEEDIRRYDIMTRTVRAQLDIPELDINMLMLPNEVNPDPAALINYNKVYVGESIPDTQGRVALIGVDIRGIAVEVEGKRYYYPK